MPCVLRLAHGSSYMIMIPSITPKWRRTNLWTIYPTQLPWFKLYWTSMERAETCHLEKASFKPETTGALCSQVVGPNTCWQVQTSYWKGYAAKYWMTEPIRFVQACFICVVWFFWNHHSKASSDFLWLIFSHLLNWLLLSAPRFYNDNRGFYFHTQRVPIILPTCNWHNPKNRPYAKQIP